MQGIGSKVAGRQGQKQYPCLTECLKDTCLHGVLRQTLTNEDLRDTVKYDYNTILVSMKMYLHPKNYSDNEKYH